MAITTQQQSNIIALTVGMFNAAPGAQFLSEFADMFENNGQSYQALADALATTGQFQSQFAGLVTQEGRINKILSNLGIQEGTDAYTTAKAHFDARIEQGATEAELIVESLEYLLGDDAAEEFADVQAQLNNKVEVATFYSVEQQQSATTLDALQGVIADVTADPATVEAAKGNVIGGTGDTFTLTTGVDVGASFTGTAGNDTFVGVDSTTAAADTINVGDSLDGGGGIDTFRMVIADNDANPITLANIENVEIAGSAATGNISAQNWSGVEKLSLKNAGVDGATTSLAQVSALASNVTIAMDNVKVAAGGNTALNVGFAAGAVTTAGALDVAVNNVGSAANAAELLVDTNGSDAFTTANLTATGTNNLTLDAQANADVALTAITVGGEGQLTLATNGNAEFTAVKTFDASENAGGVTANLSTSTETDQTITGGSGNDSFTVDLQRNININTNAGDDVVTLIDGTGTNTAVQFATNLASTTGAADSIVGGDGEDTLAVIAAGADGIDSDAAADRAVITGFERLRVTDDLDDTTINMANISGGLNYLQIGAATTTNAANVNGFTSGATVELRADNTDSTTAVNVGMTGATNAGTPSDTLNVLLNSEIATADGDVDFLLGVDGINVLNVTTADRVEATAANATAGYDLQLSNDSVVSEINVDGDQLFNYVASAAATSLSEVNASELSGNMTVNLSGYVATQGATVTGGSGVNNITGTNQGDVITGGDRADTITGGGGADTLTGGGGADIFVTPQANSAVAADGSGIDTITDFGAASDVLRFATGDKVADAGGSAVAGTSVLVSAGGKATFAAGDDLLSEKIATLVADAAITANETVFFEQGTDTYVYGAGAAADGTDDFMVKLADVTGLNTLAEGTAGDFTIA